MKACLVAYKYYESSTRLMMFANALQEQGWTVDVLCLRHKGQERQERLDNVNVKRIQIRSRNEKSKYAYLLKIILFAVRVLILLSINQIKNHYQLIHVSSIPESLVFSAIVPKVMGTPIVLDIYDIVPEYYAAKFGRAHTSFFYKRLLFVEKISCNFSDCVIVSNHLWKNRLESRSVKASKCFVILYCSDTNIFYPRKTTRRDGKLIAIYPGTLSWHQGVDVAIAAFKKVVEVIPHAEFHIFGDGTEKNNLMKQVSHYNLNKCVKINDEVPISKAAECLADADLLVVPKRARSLFGNEACSTKIVDGMNMKIPIIASRTKIESYYFDDTMIRYFESENENDLANKIIQLFSDEKLRKLLASNAYKYVIENNADSAKKEFLKIVNTLLKPR